MIMIKFVNIIIFAIFYQGINAQNKRNCENYQECIPKDQCMLNITNGEIIESDRVSCGIGNVCCDEEYNFKLMEAPSCGFRNIIGAGFYGLAEDENAQFAEFSWMASIEQDNNKICSGSLIENNLILTSSNCVEGLDASSLKVRLGSWKKTSSSSNNPNPQTEEIHEVEKILHSEKFVKQFKPNVALLVLKTSANLNMYINPVCLPSTDQDFMGKSCTVVSWGLRKSAKSELMKSDVEIQSCQSSSENTICVELDKNIEEGASLICKVENTEFVYQQIGISLSTSQRGSKTMFIKTSQFRQWIDDKATELGHELKSYNYSQLTTRWIGPLKVFLALGTALFRIFTNKKKG